MTYEEAKLIIKISLLFSDKLCHCKEFEELADKASDVLLKHIKKDKSVEFLSSDKIDEMIKNAKNNVKKIDYDAKTSINFSGNIEMPSYQVRPKDYRELDEKTFKDMLTRLLVFYLGGQPSSLYMYKLNDLKIEK